MRLPAIISLSVAVGLAGCATVERGAMDQIYIVTDPPGANVTITSSDATCVTPCRLDVGRSDEFTIFAGKSGYVTQHMDVKTKSNAPDSATSRDVTADYLGRVIDYREGANLVHVPNPVVFKLVKDK